MDSPQSVVSPFKGTSAFEKQNHHLFVENAGYLCTGNVFQRNEVMSSNLENILGVLEVFIHQARDIHNICIYHKQDVCAKLCLTSDPENTVSTRTINGGGKNPVFNEPLRLNVRTIDSSLKCEIWMPSRDRNYLEDQLIGFALVPLSEVILRNGKLEKEYSLSSTDLFHSPAGFVQLSLDYIGTLPEVIAIPPSAASMQIDASVQDVEAESVPSEFDKIEFPDPKVLNENHQMVSEYFGIPCGNLDPHSCCDTEDELRSELGVQFLKSFSTCSINSIHVTKLDSPPSSVSTYGFPSSLPVSTQSSDTPRSSTEEYASNLEGNIKDKNLDVGDDPGNASGDLPKNTFFKPLVSVNFEPEQKVLQQDIVDMYMKSMQQFTESLAKVKLPLDTDNGSTVSADSGLDQNSQTAKSSGSRVFYGSRAFF